MIYLDHAAATPVKKTALEAMMPYFSEKFFNPSSPYLPAKRIREEYEDYKNRLAHLIGAKGNDLVITSGATEANNLAFTALAGASHDTPAKILVLASEHDSILSVAEAISRSENVKVETVKADETGRLDLEDFKHKLDKTAVFISVALVNGELGTIQPLSEISELIKTERLRRLESGEVLPLFFHSDASQALGLLNISVSRLGVDLLTLNSAKVGGPKGVGALYVGHGVKLNPLTYGGGQERGLRAGTENVAGLAGFAVAAEDAKKHLVSNHKKYAEFTQIFREELLKSPIKPVFLGVKRPSNSATQNAPQNTSPRNSAKPPKPSDHQLASFCPVSFPGLDAERLIFLLEDEGVYVSTGAACAASKGEKSKTLQAIGLTDEEIAGSLRISFGETNTKSGVQSAARKILKVVEREFRRTNG